MNAGSSGVQAWWAQRLHRVNFTQTSFDFELPNGFIQSMQRFSSFIVSESSVLFFNFLGGRFHFLFLLLAYIFPKIFFFHFCFFLLFFHKLLQWLGVSAQCYMEDLTDSPFVETPSDAFFFFLNISRHTLISFSFPLSRHAVKVYVLAYLKSISYSYFGEGDCCNTLKAYVTTHPTLVGHCLTNFISIVA